MKKLLLILLLFAFNSNAQLNDGFNFEVGTSYLSVLDNGEYLTSTSFSDDGIYQFNSVRDGRVLLSKHNGSEYEYLGTIINEPTTTIGERGLIRVVYNNGYLYTFASAIPNEVFPSVTTLNYLTINKITRYDFIDETAINKKIIIGTDAADGMLSIGENHQGGDIAFDDEGYLYTAIGDGGNWAYSSIAIARGLIPQDIYDNGVSYISMSKGMLNGKVLRVHPDTGEGHPNNPYYDASNPKSPQSRIYAMGFRNPWRLHFNNGVLYVADVGSISRETIYAIKDAGVNAGWSMWEGLSKKNSGNNINPDYGIPFNEYLQDPTSFNIAENPADRQFTKYINCFDYGRSTNTTRLPYFEDGVLQTENANFNTDGSSTIGGVLIQGDALGEAMNGKFLTMDSYRSWVGVATIGTGERHFDQFDTIGNLDTTGYVHITQNPLDGSLWFTSLFRRVWKLSYDSTLSIEDKVFDYDNAKLKYHVTVLGKRVYNLKYATGLYIAVYELNGVEATRKELYKQGIRIN